MIDPQSRSQEWIEQASRLIPNIADTALVEKAIRALSLLESLVRSGCPFVFKGGTALMLHLDTSRRLSIDVDIVCPPGTEIRDYLGLYYQAMKPYIAIAEKTKVDAMKLFDAELKK